MSSINIKLAEILATVQRPGNFYATGTLEFHAPQLEVDGVGPIALPLLPVQAEQLIGVAERAPYGRGEDTILDTNVRRTWQISPEHVQIGGRNWPQTLADIIQHCAQELGVSDPVIAEFYKLLVYDEGSFFIRHRDTEKAPRMFATLIIVLPSPHSGGELRVQHRDQEVRLALGDAEPSEVTYAAFYADCVHEILPVTSGYRLALIYNLIRQRGKPPQAPDYEREQAQISALLQQWIAAKEQADDNSSPEKLVYLLDHAYTPAELSFAALKGADAVQAAALAPAATQAECDLYLALLTVEESGSAEHTGYYYGSRRGRWYEPEDDEFEVVEVFDTSKTLSHGQRPGDVPADWKELPFVDEELCPPLSIEDELEPDEQHFHEATGNEGASFERTYRRAALVLWPRANTLAILNQAGLEVTLPYLSKLAQDWIEQGAVPDSPLWQQAHTLAHHMLRTWSEAPSSYTYYRPRSGYNGQMLRALTELRDTTRLETFLRTISAQGDYNQDDNPAPVAALALFDETQAVQLMQQMISANAIREPRACAELLALSVVAKPFKNQATRLKGTAKILVETLPGDPERHSQIDSWRRPKAEADSVVYLFTALDNIDAGLAEQAADYMLAWPKDYDMDKILIPATLRLQPKNFAMAAAQKLREACLAHLRQRIVLPLAPPSDWERDSKLVCHCKDCQQLSQFLAAAEQPNWTFQAAEQRRRHMEDTIKYSHCDVDTKTSKQGRPYSLICTKNQASYERRARQREEDLDHLVQLEG